MCGFPASGKSTYARKYEAVVCPDKIRLDEFGVRFDPTIEPQVWEKAFQYVRDALEADKDVCFDATNTTRKRRAPLIEIARFYNVPIHCVYLSTPLDVCIKRDEAREQPLLKEVFERMSAQFEEPRIDEGFDSILIIKNY